MLQRRGFLYLCHKILQILSFSHNLVLQLQASRNQSLKKEGPKLNISIILYRTHLCLIFATTVITYEQANPDLVMLIIFHYVRKPTPVYGEIALPMIPTFTYQLKIHPSLQAFTRYEECRNPTTMST